MSARDEILFILPVATQPRFARRIQGYLDRGFCVQVASFERDYFDKNTLPSGIGFRSLGRIANKNYFKRIPVLLRGLLIIRREFSSIDKWYIFSADVLVLCAFLFPGKNLRYEIGDVREIKGFFSSLFAWLYKRSLHRCATIVVTSVRFREYIARTYGADAQKIIVIENKLSAKDFPPDQICRFKRLGKRLTVGIVGLLRYRNIIDFLKSYERLGPSFGVRIYGGGPLEDEIQVYTRCPGITFHGQFKYPDDLRAIYDVVDVNFVMYDSGDANVRMALPNKLYECMYFRKPLIASSGTHLAEETQRHGIGFVWDPNAMDGLVQYLDSSEFRRDYGRMEKNFEGIPTTSFLA